MPIEEPGFSSPGFLGYISQALHWLAKKFFSALGWGIFDSPEQALGAKFPGLTIRTITSVLGRAQNATTAASILMELEPQGKVARSIIPRDYGLPEGTAYRVTTLISFLDPKTGKKEWKTATLDFDRNPTQLDVLEKARKEAEKFVIQYPGKNRGGMRVEGILSTDEIQVDVVSIFRRT